MVITAGGYGPLPGLGTSAHEVVLTGSLRLKYRAGSVNTTAVARHSLTSIATDSPEVSEVEVSVSMSSCTKSARVSAGSHRSHWKVPAAAAATTSGLWAAMWRSSCASTSSASTGSLMSAEAMALR